MKIRTLKLSAVILLIFVTVSPAQESQNVTSIERIKKNIQYLASDELTGRGLGTEGINKAADHIVKQFTAFGLETDAVSGSAFQPFDFPFKTELGPKEKNRLAILTADTDSQKQIELNVEFVPMGIGSSGLVESGLVFAGYGITAEKLGYDDYAELDVKDKVVLILRREPQQSDKKSVFDGTRNSTHAYFKTKVENARRHGAKAIIIVNDGYTLKQSVRKQRTRLEFLAKKLNEISINFGKIEDPTQKQIESHTKQVTELAKSIAKFSTELAKPVDTLVSFYDGGAITARIPVIFAKRNTFNEAIKRCYDGKTLDELEIEIDKELKPVSALLSGISVDLETSIERTSTTVKNVIGVLPGKGRLASEYVVVAAHYDHVGMGGKSSGSLAPWTHEIHNGADDNGSGTCGLLETACQISKCKSDNHRTVIFIAFTAEERGLIGSKYYVEHPVFPLDQTAAMVNMDMIGRMRDNKLIVYGTGTATGFDKLVDDINDDFDFKITKKPSGYGPSDHESFYRKRIPVIHFFTGLHSDYHRPSDDVEKLNCESLAKVAQFAERTILHLMTVSTRPEFK